MAHGQKRETYHRSNIVTNSVKTLKMVHIKKSLKKDKKKKALDVMPGTRINNILRT